MPNKQDRPTAARRNTPCIVHTLLTQQQKQCTGKEDGLPDNEELNSAADKSADTPSTNGDYTESRLLTKKQLSEMAFGMRELSKSLAHQQLELHVKNVFILTKIHDNTLIKKTRDITLWLMERGYTVWTEKKLENDQAFDAKSLVIKDIKFRERLKYWDDDLCSTNPQLFDIAIALGGDGTVLYAASLFQKVVPPVMSFALGSLGFLTKFDFDDFPNILTRAFDEGVALSLRLRVEGTVMRSKASGDKKSQKNLVEELVGKGSNDGSTHEPETCFNILNEIVLDRGPNATMTSIEVFGDGEHFTTVQADGICVATPTGSTAYNLAAGGSLCHPDNPVILLTAICAHTLNFRPIILPDTIVLRVGVPYDARASCWASFDGRQRTELQPGDYVTISASRFPFPSVLPRDRGNEDWIDSISRTLNWNGRQKQKGFCDSNDHDNNEEKSK